jgi:8-hydroxy-5-deazaflavin:NADPH oxidoreductase
MRIGIIGAGNKGATLARLWARAGHQIAISNSRGPESMQDLADEIGTSLRPMTVEEAARFGEVVLLAVPFDKPDALPPAAAVAGKIVVDAMNADQGADLGGSTSSEVTEERLPGARIVKAFNTLPADTLAKEGRLSVPKAQRFVIFLAGDDGRAKSRVGGLIEEIGFAPIDTGTLALGGQLQQPGSPICERPMMPAEARQVLALTR